MKNKTKIPFFRRVMLHLQIAQTTLEAFFQMKLGWLVPLVLILLGISFLLAFISALGPLAPFVYPLL